MAYVIPPVKFLNKTVLATADLDSNFDAPVQALGGTSALGTYTGSLDYTNLKAGAGITNSQKRQPTNLLTVTMGLKTLGTASGQAICAVKMPFKGKITRVRIHYRDTTGTIGQSIATGTILLYCYQYGAYAQVVSQSVLGLAGFIGGAAPSLASSLNFAVNAGDMLTVDNTAITYNGGATGVDGLQVLVDYYADHVS